MADVLCKAISLIGLQNAIALAGIQSSCTPSSKEHENKCKIQKINASCIHQLESVIYSQTHTVTSTVSENVSVVSEIPDVSLSCLCRTKPVQILSSFNKSWLNLKVC